MKKILVVEDEPDVRATIQEVLESENYDVIAARDGKEGYELALAENPDMILSDVKMPRVNGLEMIELLHKHKKFKNKPFLFISAKVDLADIRQGMSVGADDYITKPFTIQDLLDAVELRFKKKDAPIHELEEIRDSLVKRIPHELRTPLVGILGFSELLSEDIESFSKEEILEMIQNIHQTGKRLHTIIEKYLTYAELLAPEVGDRTLEKFLKNSHEIEPEAITYELLKSFEKSDRQKDIFFEIEKAVVAMSERNFSAVLKELFENAIKFSEKGTPIRVRGIISQENYELGIEDLGTGMLEESMDKIASFRQFEPNQYLYNGVGLGLAIVKKIVENTNSTLTIKSKYGGGTMVKVSIPLSKQL
ncbi:MAG: response regulator [Ignavibacteriaceae bacterium]|jgi:K+-sensing histidine kinase KdpD